MAKKKYKIFEDKLRNIIYESVKEVLKEGGESNCNYDNAPNVNDIDISQIDIEVLKWAYRDLRLTPTTVSYGDVLSKPMAIKEAQGDIMPPDNVVNKIIQRYHLDPQLVFKVEAHHKIYIYVITAVIGINDKLIEDDMKKMGYFLGAKGDVQNINGMIFRPLQFEPTSQVQNDETTNIKSKHKVLYHWTPTYCVKDITQNGLVPSHNNELFSFPPRIYLMKGDSNMAQMLNLGFQLCIHNTNPNNNGEYALLSVNIKDLDDSVRFYYDPNSEIGIFAENAIPSDKIKVVRKANFFNGIRP